jgi:hypothetical protein
MLGLYFLYVTSLRTTVALRFQDIRIIPFALTAWMVQPVINAVISLSILNGQTRQPIGTEYPNFYTRVDYWFYISLAIALLLSWAVFDRNRLQLQKKFIEFDNSLAFRLRYLIIGCQLAFTIVLSYLKSDSPLYCLLAFAVGALLFSAIARRMTHKEDN